MDRMSRVQLALRVSDLAAAVDFYSRLFGESPAKHYDGYANFAIADPPLKLVLFQGDGRESTRLDHLGVEVQSTEEVVATTQRLRGEGLSTVTEDQTTCCFAVQDKVWVSAPGGEPWEVYTVLADVAPDDPAAACSDTVCCNLER